MATLVSSPGVTLLRGPLGSRASIRSNSISSMSLHSPDEDVTITGNRTLGNGKRKSVEELQLLALSSQITEISYSLSDIQTRIFEIQELRHQAEANAPAAVTSTASTPGELGDGPTSGGTGITTLDQALMGLEERLEAISASIASIDETLDPNLKRGGTPTQTTPSMSSGGELLAALLQKHAELKAEWESIQKEAETLQSELREDKWLAVFRSVGEQSDTMMNSLEKALANCQTFIYQVRHRGADDTLSQGSSSAGGMLADKPLNLEVFQSLLASYESKKKYYVPSISKVLGILDRTVRDRITKNGECLRTHAEARARWRSVQDRMARIDVEMENVRQILIHREQEPEPSETGSAVSRVTNKTSKSGHYLSTPSSTTRGRTGSTVSAALKRSMSPLKKMASKVTGSLRTSGRNTPSVSAATSPSMSATGAPPKPPPKSPYRAQTNRISEELNPPAPANLGAGSTRKRDSYFPFLSKDPAAGLSGRQSVASATNATSPSVSPGARPASRPSTGNDPSGTLRPKWNPSTKVEPASNTPANSRRSFQTPRPNTPSNRLERPATSQSHYLPGRPSLSAPNNGSPPQTVSRGRPPSRAGAQTPFDSGSAMLRQRPKTPSHIPGPSVSRPSSAASQVGPTSLMQRALSPASNVTESVRCHSRQASNSLIPAPKLNLSPPSRPGSSMSNGPPSAVTTSSTGVLAPQTGGAGATLYGGASPDHTPTRNLPATVGISASRQTLSRAAPSSFKSASAFTPLPAPNFRTTTPSRPGSRTNVSGGAFTPMLTEAPVYAAIRWDEMDMEVAKVVNGLPHGFTFERLDPPARRPAANAPKPEETRGQYAVSNALSRKVITCRLTTVGRGENTSKKVMCRVGGGWLDLQMYILNRQAGLQ